MLLVMIKCFFPLRVSALTCGLRASSKGLLDMVKCFFLVYRELQLWYECFYV